MDDSDGSSDSDFGDHSPAEASGNMPPSRAFDAIFFILAFIVAIALLVFILWIRP